MAWSDKDDAIDWQAYFHLRNRLVVASIYTDGSMDGILTSMAKATAKHLLCLEYSTVAIQNEAIRDFLAGPDHIRSILPTALGKVAGIRKGYPDAVVLPSATDLPTTSGEATALGVNEPKGPIAKVKALAASVVNNARPADPRHHSVPQANYPPIEARWFSLGRVDGVTVTTADGELRRLGDLLHPEHRAIELSQLILAPRRTGDLDVVQTHDAHDLCPTAKTRRKGSSTPAGVRG